MKENLKFYICDDNADFLNELKNKIDISVNDRRACDIYTFENGEELLKQFDNAFAEVVLLDINMPGMNGFEVASLLQKRKEDVFIVFVTSHEDKVYQAYEYHPFWFIRKSHMHDLNVVIPKLLRKIDAEEERKRLIFNLKAENCMLELDLFCRTGINLRHASVKRAGMFTKNCCRMQRIRKCAEVRYTILRA